MDLENTADSGTEFDIGAAMDQISGVDLEGAGTEVTPKEGELFPEGEATDKAATTTTETAPTVREPPKSWSKEMHEEWSKMTPKAQDYYVQREKQMLDGIEQYKGDASYAKQLREIVTPYTPMLQSMGVSEADAVKFLLNAQYQLSNGTMEQRKAAYERIGADLGFIQQQQQAQVDPAVRQLQEQLRRVESSLTARQQADLQAAQSKAASEVEAFGSDPSHGYFDDVAQDMVPLINAGLTLADAYERAVWSNPVTRAKEQARLQTEAAAQAKEKVRAEGNAARKATGANVRGIESQKAPTEPKGSFKNLDASMAETLAGIKNRVN